LHHGRFVANRPFVGLGAVLLAAALAACVRFLAEPRGRTVAGHAFVVDGDTLRIGPDRIRIEGIDAPELDQTCRRRGRPLPCGEQARDALLAMLSGRTVTCRTSGRDRYGRFLARCEAGGEDIGARMVAEGRAVSDGDYRLLEARARFRSAGIWATAFERPQDWRRRNGF